MASPSVLAVEACGWRTIRGRSQCSCSRLAERARQPPLEVVLGTWRRILENAKTCHLCQEISERIRELSDPPLKSRCKVICPAAGGYGTSDREWAIVVMNKGFGKQPRRVFAKLLFYLVSRVTADTPVIAGIGTRTINLHRIARWPAYCELHHQGSCKQSSVQIKTSPTSSLRMIDTHAGCLTTVRHPARYVALSYVWGDSSHTVQATMANYDELCVPGALKAPVYCNLVPKTIQDAMTVVEEMGERYLWVDRMCIIQDDTKDKHRQLAHMASIYANAYFTLVAMDGDHSDFGLAGVDLHSRPRQLKRTLLEFASDLTLSYQPGPIFGQTEKPWSKRGWTYQERLLSSRCLVFSDDSVSWICPSASWQEGFFSEADFADNRVGLVRIGSAQQSADRFFVVDEWPSTKVYANVIEKYNGRELTYPTDGLRAVSAILDVLFEPFPNDSIYGLPEFYFDASLLWGPSQQQPLERRGSAQGVFGDDYLPTWSWAGWQGHVHNPLLEGIDVCWGFDYYPGQLIPIVEWRKTEKETGLTFPISNSLFTYISFSANPDIQYVRTNLPAGWTVGRSLYPINGRLWGFRHKNFSTKHFLYPYPMATASESTRRIWEPFISAEAKRAYLTVDALRTRTTRGREHSYLSLANATGEFAGVLQPQSLNPSLSFVGVLCELVAISRGSQHIESRIRLSWELREFEQLQGLEVYEFYSVLWIEWDKGVAYRKGLGRIPKEIWEQLNLESIDLVLG